MKTAVKRLVSKLGYEIRRDPFASYALKKIRSADEQWLDRALERVRPYTMTNPARIVALCDAVEYVVRHNIPGSLVECGVWRGGSVMAMLMMLQRLGVSDRELFLFDTFEGMTPPGDKDRDRSGRTAASFLNDESDRTASLVWAHCDLNDVKANVAAVGYDANRIHYVKGRVEDTLPAAAPDAIALLRLDTDWYDSTYHEMRELYPRLAVGGVLIIDDYGHWQGAKRAIDNYLTETRLRLFLHRIDYSARIGIKQLTG